MKPAPLERTLNIPDDYEVLFLGGEPACTLASQ